MRTIAALLLTLACAAAPAAHAQVQAPPQKPLTEGQSVALGRALAHRNCAMCHAVAIEGASPNPQAPPFRDLHQRGDVEMLGEGLAQGILTGHPAMPEFRFQPHEVVALVRYLRSVQSKRKIGLGLGG